MRWAPRPFANLRAYLEWYADDGKNTPCCRFATDDEIAAMPERFTCATCEHVLQRGALWRVNQRAFRIYTQLCGRTTGELGLAGRLFQAATEGWSPADVLDLIARIEVIREVLDPPKSRPTA